MKHYLTIGKTPVRLGVCPTTLRRWNRDGKICCYRKSSGHRRFALIEIEKSLSGGLTEEGEGIEKSGSFDGLKTAIYARVSTHEQKKKEDLDRQIEAAKEYCEKRGSASSKVFKDVSSGLNTKRMGLMRLCQAIERKEIDRVIITYPDRLTRFGLAYLTNYFGSHGATVEVME
ncbi:MAG: IS607 family transposase [Candidatus Hodarchaeota archaeon]